MNNRLLPSLALILLTGMTTAHAARAACQPTEVKGVINAVLDEGFTFADRRGGVTRFVPYVPATAAVPLSVGVKVEGKGCPTVEGSTLILLADVRVISERRRVEKVELRQPAESPADNTGNDGGGGNNDVPPGDNTGDVPPGDNTGDVPPGDNTGDVPPGDNTGSGTTPPTGFTAIADGLWDTAAVRKVLQVFAYGGDANDAQIDAWAAMPPASAVREMLTFDCTAPCALQDLQDLWSSADPANPVRPDRRRYYAAKQTGADGMPSMRVADGTNILSTTNLQNTWIASVNKAGLNPFRQQVGLWLTNYRMSVSLRNVDPTLIASFYDAALDALAQGASFDEVLALGASEAALARQYGHQTNTYNNNTGLFRGNDDFAREFHQLFFGINGEGEDADFHENVTIENTALLLTGMQIDRDPLAYGGNLRNQDQYVAPIDFSDHRDAAGRNLRNRTLHHQADLEILRSPPGPGGSVSVISGFDAEQKLYELARTAIEYDESLDVLPVGIIEFFADDNITPDKAAAIRAHWRGLQPKDLLTFLRDYATSTTFHRDDTFKYRSAFSRNMALHNLNTPDDGWAYANDYAPNGAASVHARMVDQGAEVFVPAKAVFGGQTGVDAASSPDLFKQAYNLAVDFSQRRGLENPVAHTVWNYTPADPSNCAGALLANGNCQVRKEWAAVMPPRPGGYLVADVARWLWERFISDGGKHYGPLERAHISCLLATGLDCAYLLDLNNPDGADVTPAGLETLADSLAGQTIALDAGNARVRREANRRMGMAINFISVTPYMFAVEGR